MCTFTSAKYHCSLLLLAAEQLGLQVLPKGFWAGQWMLREERACLNSPPLPTFPQPIWGLNWQPSIHGPASLTSRPLLPPHNIKHTTSSSYSVDYEAMVTVCCSLCYNLSSLSQLLQAVSCSSCS